MHGIFDQPEGRSGEDRQCRAQRQRPERAVGFRQRQIQKLGPLCFGGKGRFHLPAGVHRHRAQRSPALRDASSMARFAVAGRACGLCGQLIRE